MFTHHRRQASEPAPIRKEDADCCMLVASRDPHGRPPIGWCGDDCERLAQHLRRYGG